MQLYGSDLSPFYRRVAMSLDLLGMGFEPVPVKVQPDRERIEALNPLGRVPILVLADGETLIDNYAILDHLDQAVGPERALIPAGGRARRDALKLIAIGHGTLEKAVLSFYERTRRPEQFRWDEGVARYDEQTRAGMNALVAACDAAKAAGSTYLSGQDRPMAVDVMVTAVWEFLGNVHPDLRSEYEGTALLDYCRLKTR